MQSITSTSYRGCRYLAAILDLNPKLRRDALSLVEPEDFTAKAYRTIFQALLDMDGLDTISGRQAAGLALRDHLSDTGELGGEFGYSVRQALLDIVSEDALGEEAFPIAVRLRADRYLEAMNRHIRRMTKAVDSGCVETVTEQFAEDIHFLRPLAMRATPQRISRLEEVA